MQKIIKKKTKPINLTSKIAQENNWMLEKSTQISPPLPYINNSKPSSSPSPPPSLLFISSPLANPYLPNLSTPTVPGQFHQISQNGQGWISK
jgi:hypothetical protein